MTRSATTRRLTFHCTLIGVFFCCAFLNPLRSSADEGAHCPDLRPSQQLLEEGKAQLRIRKTFDRESPRDLYKDAQIFHNDLIYESNGWSKAPVNSPYKGRIFFLNTDAEITLASSIVENMVGFNALDEAIELQDRIVDVLNDKKKQDSRLASALGLQARIDFLRNLEMRAKDKAEREPDKRRAKPVFATSMERRSKYIIAELAENADRETLTDGEKAYEKVLKIRRGILSDLDEKEIDVIVLAEIKDHLDKQSEALKLYKTLSIQNITTSKYAASYARKHRNVDLAKQWEAQFLVLLDQYKIVGPSLELIQTYLDSDKTSDAKRLFFDVTQRSKRLPPTIITRVIPYLTSSEKARLSQYLSEVWLREAQDHEVDWLMSDAAEHGGAHLILPIATVVSRDSYVASRLMRAAKCFTEAGDAQQSIAIYKKAISRIEETNKSDENAIQDLEAITSALKKTKLRNLPETQAVMDQANKNIAFHKDRIRREECLTVAKDLTKTAGRLEMRDEYAMAQKLYQQALEIKKKNLDQNDPSIAMQMIDVAHAAAGQKHYEDAVDLYDRALANLRTNEHATVSDKIAALQNFGEMLNAMNDTKRAETIYDEARTLARQAGAK